MVQTKERSYHSWHAIDQFLPLASEVFGCLHKHVDVFLHNCANVIWSLKGLESFHLFIRVTFFHQKISITLQKMQAFSILSWEVAIGLTTSWLPPLPSRHTFHRHGRHIVDCRFLTSRNVPSPWPTYCRLSIFDIEKFWHLVWGNLMSCKFSIFLFLIHLYAFQIYGVFINKSFAGLHHHFQNSSGRGSMFYPLVGGYLIFKQPTIPMFFQHFRIKELSVPIFEKK